MYSFVFDGLVERALAAGFSVLTYDRPGRGRSPWPVGARSTEAFSVAVLRGVVTTLLRGRGRAVDVLLGISMGGAIAASYVAAFGSTSCNRLVLMAPAGLPLTPQRLHERLIYAPLGIGLALFRRLALANMVSSQADGFGVPGAPSNAAAIKRCEDELQAQWATPGLGFVEALHSTLSNYPLGQSPGLLLTDAFRAVERAGVATLVLWGTADRICPFTNLAALAALIPSARVHTVEGAGHELLHEQFDTSWDAILRFASPAFALTKG